MKITSRTRGKDAAVLVLGMEAPGRRPTSVDERQDIGGTGRISIRITPAHELHRLASLDELAAMRFHPRGVSQFASTASLRPTPASRSSGVWVLIDPPTDHLTLLEAPIKKRPHPRRTTHVERSRHSPTWRATAWPRRRCQLAIGALSCGMSRQRKSPQLWARLAPRSPLPGRGPSQYLKSGGSTLIAVHPAQDNCMHLDPPPVRPLGKDHRSLAPVEDEVDAHAEPGA